jgi:hypothetical protein
MRTRSEGKLVRRQGLDMANADGGGCEMEIEPGRTPARIDLKH